jgi:hypothetical protein
LKDGGGHPVGFSDRDAEPSDEFQGERQLGEALDGEAPVTSLPADGEGSRPDPCEDVVELLGSDPQDSRRGGGGDGSQNILINENKMIRENPSTG